MHGTLQGRRTATPLYAWQPVCKWVKTEQKTVPLWYLSGNNQCPDFKKRYPLTVPNSGSKRNIFLQTSYSVRLFKHEEEKPDNHSAYRFWSSG